MFEKIVAAIALALCVGLLLRLALPAAARSRIDARLRRARAATAGGWDRLRHGRRRRIDAERAAARLAEEAIRRARRGARRGDEKVERPESFRRPRKPH
jgi:hypothetical protein